MQELAYEIEVSNYLVSLPLPCRPVSPLGMAFDSFLVLVPAYEQLPRFELHPLVERRVTGWPFGSDALTAHGLNKLTSDRFVAISRAIRPQEINSIIRREHSEVGDHINSLCQLPETLHHAELEFLRAKIRQQMFKRIRHWALGRV